VGECYMSRINFTCGLFITGTTVITFLDQELIPYRYSTCFVVVFLVVATVLKKPMLRRFKSDRDEI